MGKFGNWTRSETYRAIISDNPDDGWPDAENVAAYGGFMVCESVAKDDAANLITAAPELLKEAEWALDILTDQFALDDECEGIVALRAAISKATGRG